MSLSSLFSNAKKYQKEKNEEEVVMEVELGTTKKDDNNDGNNNISIITRRHRRQTKKLRKQQQSLNNSFFMNQRKKEIKRKQKRKRSNTTNDICCDIPFWLLLLQVGSGVFLVMIIFYGLIRYCYNSIAEEKGREGVMDDNDDIFEEVVLEPLQQMKVQELLAPTFSPKLLPIWELSTKASYYDAYGLIATFRPEADNDSFSSWKNRFQNYWFGTTKDEEESNNTIKNYHEFWNLSKALRIEFSDLYGGENAARALLERGLTTFATTTTSINTPPSDIVATACRFHQSSSSGVFKMAFGGYSVTVGRGNYFNQSYPFVLQGLLEPIMASLQIELQVRNAAIGGIPSFPYGWCMENFWQLSSSNNHVDVVSWDYSMNEAGGIPQGLEAYLRQIYAQSHNIDNNNIPLLVVKDTHMAKERRDLLQQYAADGGGMTRDTIVIHVDPAIRPFVSRKEQDRPKGFQEWRKFGAPPDAPGQSAHHPALAEHKLLGWMLTMHFLAALEYYVLQLEGKLPQQTTMAANNNHRQQQQQCLQQEIKASLPTYPISVNNTVSTASSNILFSTSHHVHCRTSYEPIVMGKLSEIVTSGVAVAENEQRQEVLSFLPKKGLHQYNKGWVLDLSTSERLAKRKLDRYGGLGFVDSKKAYYGIYNSGPISFHIPTNSSSSSSNKVVVKSIVLCRVNERERPSEACDLTTHVEYLIGSINMTNNGTIMSQPGTLYLGHSLCMQFQIPSSLSRRILSVYNGIVGVNVTVRVMDIHIRKTELACSISHVIWEEGEEI